mgnify:CR=1 FL=1
MQMYRNYKTFKSIVRPNTAGASGNSSSTSLSTGPSIQRSSRLRQFYQAVAHNRVTSNNSYVLSLTLTSGSSTYYLDRVTLLPGETHVWNEQDYGMDLSSKESVNLSWFIASAHSNDELHLFIRTRDLASG